MFYSLFPRSSCVKLIHEIDHFVFFVPDHGRSVQKDEVFSDTEMSNYYLIDENTYFCAKTASDVSKKCRTRNTVGMHYL